jgi:hypothetical protein
MAGFARDWFTSGKHVLIGAQAAGFCRREEQELSGSPYRVGPHWVENGPGENAEPDRRRQTKIKTHAGERLDEWQRLEPSGKPAGKPSGWWSLGEGTYALERQQELKNEDWATKLAAEQGRRAKKMVSRRGGEPDPSAG